MKKIIIALVMVGFSWAGAQAQTKCVCPAKKVAVHKKIQHSVRHNINTTPTAMVTTNRAYQVCREEGGYYSCCLYKSTSVTPSGNTLIK